MKKTIGWQKYEDFLEQQINSPFVQDLILKQIANNLDEEGEGYEHEEEVLDQTTKPPIVVPITQNLMDDIGMITSFNCWIGHTNFDITHRLKEKLNKTPGIELLKVCSRYRFFIGIGKMFKFNQVREYIEKTIKEDDL